MYQLYYSPERILALPWSIFGVIIVFVLLKLTWRLQLRDAASRQRTEFDLEKLAPYPAEKIKGFEKYRIRMNLKKMDRENWLTVDKEYALLHGLRTDLFNGEKEKMVQYLPEAREACLEALQEVSKFLSERYPAMFQISENGSRQKIENKKTGEEYIINSWGDTISPLEIAARLGMDDLTIILRNKDEVHYMAATASCFQIGWSADERIGDTIAQMHAPVPQWEKEIGYAVNKFMARLTPEMPMERASYFIQISDPGESLPQILFQPVGVVHTNLEPQPDHIIIRKERQSFTRLPKSGSILFAVRTTLTYLPDLPDEELENMTTEINSWPEDMARYKGREHWGHVVLEYGKRRALKKKSLSASIENSGLEI